MGAGGFNKLQFTEIALNCIWLRNEYNCNNNKQMDTEKKVVYAIFERTATSSQTQKYTFFSKAGSPLSSAIEEAITKYGVNLNNEQAYYQVLAPSQPSLQGTVKMIF